MHIVAPQYSSPFHSGNRAIHYVVLSRYVENTVDRFLEGLPPELVGIAERVAPLDIGKEDLWFGQVERSYQTGAMEISRTVSALLGMVFSHSSSSFRVDGEFLNLLKVFASKHSERDHLLALIEKLVAFHSIDRVSRRSGIVSFKSLGVGGLDNANTGSIVNYFDVTPVDSDVWISTLDRSLELLHATSEDVYRWVSDIISCIIVVPHHEGMEVSGSWKDLPGMIFMSGQPDSIAVADILIHEASHQYFHWVERMGKILTSDQCGEFYSPPVGRNRPLDRILIAYHAFKNVLDFFYLLRLTGNVNLDGHLARIDRYNRFTNGLSEVIEKNVQCYTPLGWSLYRGLALAPND